MNNSQDHKAKQRLVIKLGSSTLTAGTERISRGKIEDISRQIVSLQEDYEIILVSSGAIAAARHNIAVNHWQMLESKQAMAAIGQPLLLHIYQEVFRDFDIRSAQCLLTYRDFSNPIAEENTRNTLNDLLAHGYLPIVNENDTVATEEIEFGDNDKLSAYVAGLLQADILMLASDIDGLFTANPHENPDAEFISEVSDLVVAREMIDERDSDIGTGGMTSKLQAAEICQQAGIEMWIVNGGRADFITDSISGARRCTKFKFA
ncbi:MAG: glutamate 5-kinase [Xanthomonadales bacterium]|nr:glutamate 5-kinase [Xanthomonadales bacterium]